MSNRKAAVARVGTRLQKENFRPAFHSEKLMTGTMNVRLKQWMMRFVYTAHIFLL